MSKAIISKWSCPSCGNVIKTSEPLTIAAGKHCFKGPNKCGCGKKGSFKLLTFEPAWAAVIKDGRDIIQVPSDRFGELNQIVREKLSELPKEEEKSKEEFG